MSLARRSSSDTIWRPASTAPRKRGVPGDTASRAAVPRRRPEPEGAARTYHTGLIAGTARADDWVLRGDSPSPGAARLSPPQQVTDGFPALTDDAPRPGCPDPAGVRRGREPVAAVSLP